MLAWAMPPNKALRGGQRGTGQKRVDEPACAPYQPEHRLVIGDQAAQPSMALRQHLCHVYRRARGVMQSF